MSQSYTDCLFTIVPYCSKMNTLKNMHRYIHLKIFVFVYKRQNAHYKYRDTLNEPLSCSLHCDLKTLDVVANDALRIATGAFRSTPLEPQDCKSINSDLSSHIYANNLPVISMICSFLYYFVGHCNRSKYAYHT